MDQIFHQTQTVKFCIDDNSYDADKNGSYLLALFINMMMMSFYDMGGSRIIFPIIYVDSLYTILNQAKFSVAYPLDQVVYRWHDPQVIISLISSFPFFINHYYQNDNHDHGHEHDGISAKNLRWQLVTKGSCSCRSLRSWGQSTGFRIIMVISGSSSNSMNVLACSSCSLPRSFAMEEF